MARLPGSQEAVDAAAPSQDAAAAPSDAARPATESGLPGLADATTYVDAGGEAPIDATQAVDASDAFADSTDAPDWPSVTHNEVCHVIWPQPDGFQGLGNITMPLVVDPSGNAYVEIPYSANPPLAPPIDLGVSSPGDPVGFVIAKVDPQCHLVWMREFGGPPGSTDDGGDPYIVGSIAVDATSSVTVAGTFNGPVDLGSGPLNGYQIGYVLRLDADGGVVFTHTYPGMFPTLLGVQADGSAALLFFDYSAFSSAYACGVAGICEGGMPEAGADFYAYVQLDATGVELTRNPFPGYPGITGLGPSTFTDVSLDPAGVLWAMDNYADAGPSVERLTALGVPIWSQAIPGGGQLALGPAGGVVYSPSNTSRQETFDLVGFDGGSAWSATLSLATSSPSFHDVAIDSKGMVYAAGQVDPRALPAGDAQWPMNVVGVEVLDPLGQPQGIRAWASGGDDYYGSTAVGVDPSGNAVIGGYSLDDGGYSYFIVRLGP